MMPSIFSRMTHEQRMTWAQGEHFLRETLGFDHEQWRRREQKIGATSAEAGRAIRRYLKEIANA